MSSDSTTNTTFSNDVQDSLLELEDNSWWFIYRANVIIGLLDRFLSPKKLTLDIGGGNGYTSYIAQKRGYQIGIIEPSFEACKHAKARGIDEINCGSVTRDSVLDESIEQAMLLDVLEHIKNDGEFIKLLNTKMTRGGYYSLQYLPLCVFGVAKMMQRVILEDTG